MGAYTDAQRKAERIERALRREHLWLSGSIEACRDGDIVLWPYGGVVVHSVREALEVARREIALDEAR